jgi:hypothetical protein
MLTALILTCGIAHAATVTLAWSPPAGNDVWEPIYEYTLWQRRVPQSADYTLLKHVPMGATRNTVTLPKSTTGAVCYQLRAVRWDGAARVVVSTSPPAAVEGQPTCTALCTPLGTTRPALKAGECYH